MHELSIAMSILEIAEEEAGRHGGARVAAIHLQLGPLSGVVRESLLSAYDLAREGSPLADAHLRIQEVPLVLHCPACHADQTLEGMQSLCCPSCGSIECDVISGRELDVTGLEIEETVSERPGCSTDQA